MSSFGFDDPMAVYGDPLSEEEQKKARPPMGTPSERNLKTISSLLGSAIGGMGNMDLATPAGKGLAGAGMIPIQALSGMAQPGMGGFDGGEFAAQLAKALALRQGAGGGGSY